MGKGSKRVCASILILLIAGLLHSIFRGSALVSQIPLLWTAIGIGVGGVLGMSMSIVFFLGINDKSNQFGKISAMLLMPVLAAMVGSYCGRLIYELESFHNYNLKQVTLRAPVTSTSGGRGGPFAYVTAYPGARELQVRVDADLYNQLKPNVRPGVDCLILQGEIGRNGVTRTVLPTPFDRRWGVEKLTPCDIGRR